MKQFIYLFLLTFFIGQQTFGAAAEPESTVKNPPFYRLRYQKDGADRHLFVLGTAHRLPVSVLPAGVQHHINQATCLLSELGLSDWKKDPTDAIDTLKAQVPVTKCLKSNGELFPETENGWLSLLEPAEAHTIEAKLPKHFASTELVLVRDLYTVCPSETFSYLRNKMLRDLHPDATSRTDGMDGALASVFNRKALSVCALETYGTRLESFNRYYGANGHNDPHYDHSLEYCAHGISYLMNTPSEEIKAGLNELYKATSTDIAEYNTSTSGDFPEDLWTNYRNQYWIAHTLRQIFAQDGVGLIAVGQCHLDMGCIPDIGKTGLLNFFEALKQTRKTWNSITVEGIDLWNPDPAASWIPMEGISTEGRYLTELMASL